MAGELTNADRKALNRERKARLSRKGALVISAPAKAAAPPPEPGDRDGLVWLHGKKRLTAIQTAKGFEYRDIFRQCRDGGSIPSNIPTGRVGRGVRSGLPFGASFSDSAAKLQLFVIKWNVLLEQPDLITVMDGVCGIGHTVRFLAGGDQLRAAQLEASLRIALDMIVASDNAKDAAKAKLSEKAA